jgi:peroxiredoxin
MSRVADAPSSFPTPNVRRDLRPKQQVTSLTLLSGLCEGFAGRCRSVSASLSTVSTSLLVSPKAALLAGFAALALACVSVAPAAEKYDLVGQPAPELVARGLSGENVRISEHRGEVVVVSFWSGSCNTCRAQLEALDRIAKTYASAGLTVIGVNLDDNVARAEKFARSQDVQFQLLVSTAKSTGREYRIDRLPMIVFVDRAGVLRAAHREFRKQDEAMYVRELRTLLDE